MPQLCQFIIHLDSFIIATEGITAAPSTSQRRPAKFECDKRHVMCGE